MHASVTLRSWMMALVIGLMMAGCGKDEPAPVATTPAPAADTPAATQEFGAVDAQMGVESYISLRDDGNGHLLRRDGHSDQWENVNVAFGERSLIIRFARADVLVASPAAASHA